jgi:hypothetical protein
LVNHKNEGFTHIVGLKQLEELGAHLYSGTKTKDNKSLVITSSQKMQLAIDGSAEHKIEYGYP